MALVVRPPEIKEYAFPKDLLEKYGEGDGKAFIAVRPATFAENSKRDARFSRFRRVIEDDGDARLESDIDLSELYAYEIYLTLAECDIEVEKPDGSTRKLFRFRNNKLAMSFDQFVEALGYLPDEIVRWIHDKVIETNPQWGPEGKEQ